MAKFEYMQRAFSSELKPRARLVLQVLVLHCNKEGECFPSIKTIAAKCGYGVSTVKRALDEDVYKRQIQASRIKSENNSFEIPLPSVSKSIARPNSGQRNTCRPSQTK